jgi:serine phosphatase RsbU (regulator of sigma subunit)
MLQMLGRGVFPTQKMKVSQDEIGEMTLALNNLVDGLKRTTNFSNQVGMGNFDYPYVPLSDEDVLGHALLKMRDDLAENERILEQKVIERTEEVVRQKEEIEKQRQKLEELYKDVTDSIRYAKRLQESILPPDFMVRNMLPDSFVLYKPKDIVSGDFYWFHKRQSKILFAAVDCTGHGVPGAFMSLVGSNAINQATKEHGLIQPSLILDDINKISSEALNKGVEKNSVRDGMDIAFCSFDTESKELEFAGANNPLYLVRAGELTQIKPDTFAIGGFEPGTKKYTNHKLKLQKNDCLYIFSDGYADQFGGIKGKKFMYRQFRNLILSIVNKPMDEQKKYLDEAIEKWRGRYEQVDDMLIIGVRVL